MHLYPTCDSTISQILSKISSFCKQNWLQILQKSMLQTIENYVAIQSHFFIYFNLKPVSETGRKAIQNGSGRLRCLQDAPRSCQKASKKLLRDPKTASRARKRLHGHPKFPPRRVQTLQKSYKAFHDAPRGLPDTPKPPG